MFKKFLRAKEKLFTYLGHAVWGKKRQQTISEVFDESFKPQVFYQTVQDQISDASDNALKFANAFIHRRPRTKNKWLLQNPDALDKLDTQSLSLVFFSLEMPLKNKYDLFEKYKESAKASKTLKQAIQDIEDQFYMPTRITSLCHKGSYLDVGKAL